MSEILTDAELADLLDYYREDGPEDNVHVADTIVKHYATLRARCEEPERRLAAFGRVIIEAFFNEGEFGDLDGAWVQDKAVDSGLLVHPAVPHSPDDCECCADEPGLCYVLADDILASSPPPETGKGGA